MLYFFVFGTIMLIMLTYQDIKKMVVDSRANYIMHGLALSLITHYDYNVWFVIVLIFGFFLLKPRLQKFIGKGDLTAIHWILYGTFIINPLITGLFALVFTFVTIIYGTLKLFFFGKKNMATPFYPVILSSFAITGYFYFIDILSYFIYFP